MNQFIKGSYETVKEANSAIDQLIVQGYNKDDITLVSNASTHSTIRTDVPTKVYNGPESSDEQNDESFIEKVKDIFTSDSANNTTQQTSDNENTLLNDYQNDLDAGHIVVLVQENPNTDSVTNYETTEPVEPPMDPIVKSSTDETNTEGKQSSSAQQSAHTSDNQKESIKLKEEELDINKHEEQTGKVHIQKNVTEETITVDVPVKHEDIKIEKHPASSDTPSDTTIEEGEEITIPLSEEQIDVTKRPVVKNEVTIEKETKEDTQRVSESLRKENAEVQTEGALHLEDDKAKDDENRKS